MKHRTKTEMPILLKGARLIDPQVKSDAVGDILIEGELISSVGRNIKPGRNTHIVDCRGLIICPGFCDAHVHLRTPGQERKENIITGCRAAARGGITTMVTMPNTSPPVDNPDRVASILNRYSREGALEIHITGAISRNQDGVETADLDGMLNSGAIAFTDDGRWVKSSAIMRKALEFSRDNDIIISSHAEDASLHKKGCINRGSVSRSLRLPGIPAESEIDAIRRDIKLARETGGRVHIQHISTGRGLDLVRKAKKKGIRVTCEATPHHLILNEEAIPELGSLAKMNPPLRTERDRMALIEGIADGTIDIIATDHAPHTRAEKRKGLRDAPFGVTGMETMFASVHDELVLGGVVSLSRLIELIAITPRSLFGLEGISLKRGSRADLAIINPDLPWKVRVMDFQSKGSNSPFIGWTFTTKVIGTFHKGKPVFVDGLLI